MKICLIVDDNAGYTETEAKKLGLTVIPMPILINDETHFENRTIDTETFYKRMAANDDIRTSQPFISEISNTWKEKLKEYDQIIHMPMSSGLSASCENAIALSETDDFKGKVFVVDNHRISITLKTAVEDIFNLIKAGYEGSEIKKIMEDTGFDSTIYIMVDTMKYLVKGGRCTKAAGALATFLNIKPVLTIKGEKLDAYKKVIGPRQAQKVMMDAIKNDLTTKFKDFPRNEMVFGMAYTYNLESANEFKKQVLAEFGLTQDQILLDPLSLSVSTHIGPGALAIAVTHKLQVKKK